MEVRLTGIIVGFLYPLHFASMEEERQGRFSSLFSLQFLSFLLEGKKAPCINSSCLLFLSLSFFFCVLGATPIMEYTPLFVFHFANERHALASGKPGNPIAGIHHPALRSRFTDGNVYYSFLMHLHEVIIYAIHYHGSVNPHQKRK